MACHLGPTGGGGGGGGDNNGDDGGEDTVLNYDQVTAWAAKNKVELPADMVQTAKAMGLRLSALNAFAALRGGAIAGMLMRAAPWVRDRLIADDKFLFKVVAEVVIDTGARRHQRRWSCMLTLAKPAPRAHHCG